MEKKNGAPCAESPTQPPIPQHLLSETHVHEILSRTFQVSEELSTIHFSSEREEVTVRLWGEEPQSSDKILSTNGTMLALISFLWKHYDLEMK